MAYQPTITLDPRLARRLAEKKALLDAFRPLSASTVRLLHEELRVSLTYHSNAIEGNTLSERETALVIEHGMTIGGHSLREHLEATNHAEAYDALQALASAETPLTAQNILDLHKLVMDKLLDEAGQFRSGAVSIRGARLVPPPAREVPGLVGEWLGWLSGDGGTFDPVIRAALAHHGFVAVHPFRDGNGRTGRLLLNLLLMRSGYPPALLLRDWRFGYLEALAQADRGRFSPLVNMIGRAVESGLDMYLNACNADATNEETLPLSALAPLVGMDSEYLGLLIRKGRIAATKQAGRWFCTRGAVARYRAEVAAKAVPRGRPRTRKA